MRPERKTPELLHPLKNEGGVPTVQPARPASDETPVRRLRHVSTIARTTKAAPTASEDAFADTERLNWPDRWDLLGRTIGGRYRVECILGEGTSGIVFEGRCGLTGRRCAIKTLKRKVAHDADLRRRLDLEAKIAWHVTHPGVPQLYGGGVLEDGTPFLAYELLVGESLSAVLDREQRLSSAEVALIGLRLAEILVAVHQSGIVHRDIKPDHIYLQDKGGHLHVSLLDFGVCQVPWATSVERDRERGRVYGTPNYTSPEQAAGDPDVGPQADIFSLGVIMFEALTGRRPFIEKNVTKLLLKIMESNAPSVHIDRPDVDHRLAVILDWMLQRDRNVRMRSAANLLTMLPTIIGAFGPVEARMLSKLQPVRSPTNNLRQRAASAV